MTVTIHFYDNFIQDLGLQRINLGSDVFKAILVNGYTFNSSHNSKSQISSELPTGNGYTVGGLTLTTTWTFNAGLNKFDSDDESWTATGGSIGPATGIIIYNDTVTLPTADRLMCYVDFGSEQTALDGTELKLIFDSNGIFIIG